MKPETKLTLIPWAAIFASHLLASIALVCAVLFELFSKQHGHDGIAVQVIGLAGTLVCFLAAQLKSKLDVASAEKNIEEVHSLSSRAFGLTVLGLVAAIGIPLVSPNSGLWSTPLFVLPGLILTLVDKVKCFMEADNLKYSHEQNDKLVRILRDEPNLRDPRLTEQSRQQANAQRELELLGRVNSGLADKVRVNIKPQGQPTKTAQHVERKSRRFDL